MEENKGIIINNTIYSAYLWYKFACFKSKQKKNMTVYIFSHKAGIKKKALPP